MIFSILSLIVYNQETNMKGQIGFKLFLRFIKFLKFAKSIQLIDRNRKK